MIKISYLIKSPRLRENVLRRLESKHKELVDEGKNIEFIIYTSNYKGRKKYSSNFQIISKERLDQSLQKAVVTGTGDYFILIAAESVVSNNLNTIFYLIKKHLNDVKFDVAIEKSSRSFFLKKYFLALYDIGFVIIKSSYAKRSVVNFVDPCSIIYKAIQSNGLFFFSPNMVNFKGKLINSFYYSKLINYRRDKSDPINHNISNVPIFIICRDRLSSLKRLIKWLESENHSNIIIIDNASSYGPLLKYYETLNYEIVRLGKNIGQTSPWDSGAINLYAHNKYYVVTDPDVIPQKEARFAIKHFLNLLNKYPKYIKVGFGLKIDDIPDYYDLKESVLKWEKKFWVNEIESDVYIAEIDTTFALYRPDTVYSHGPSLRTGGKYVAKHEGWYIKSSAPDKETLYYRNKVNREAGSWGLSKNDTSEYHKKNYEIS